MMFSPRVTTRVPLPTIVPAMTEMIGLTSAYTASLASGTWGTANLARFYPLRLPEPYPVAKAFWCNGATVGTDSIDLAVYRMTDLVTGRLDLIRSTGAVLSAGTASVVQEVSAWKVARTLLTNGNSSDDATSYATASVVLKAGRLYLMAVENSAASAGAVSVISGGPTFTSRATTQYNGTANRVSLWSAVPTVDSTGALTIDFGGGNTQTGCVWALVEMSGVDTSTTDGIVQVATGTGNSTTPLATLAAFANANNATFACHANVGDSTTTPGSGFTELSDDGAATPAQYLETQWRVDNDTTANAGISSGEWGSIAAEVKADASAFVIPAGWSGDIYMGMSISGTTATVIRGTAGLPGSRLGGALECATAFPLPSTCVLAAQAASRVPMAGFSSS